jgi:hypothetical protein
MSAVTPIADKRGCGSRSLISIKSICSHMHLRSVKMRPLVASSRRVKSPAHGCDLECPLWVISGQTTLGQKPPLSALVQKRTNTGAVGLSALCQKQACDGAALGRSCSCRAIRPLLFGLANALHRTFGVEKTLLAYAERASKTLSIPKN